MRNRKAQRLGSTVYSCCALSFYFGSRWVHLLWNVDPHLFSFRSLAMFCHSRNRYTLTFFSPLLPSGHAVGDSWFRLPRQEPKLGPSVGQSRFASPPIAFLEYTRRTNALLFCTNRLARLLDIRSRVSTVITFLYYITFFQSNEGNLRFE